MKLTKPQQELLTNAIQAGRYTCDPNYKPAKKLVELELVTMHEGRFGGCTIVPTEAGRAVHSANQ